MRVMLVRPRTSRLTFCAIRRLADWRRFANSKDNIKNLKGEEDATPFSGVAEKYLNRVTLLGRAGADPRLSGGAAAAHPVASFPLATDRPFRDPDTGAERSKTEWHRVAVFAPAARDSAMRGVRKGCREGDSVVEKMLLLF